MVSAVMMRTIKPEFWGVWRARHEFPRTNMNYKRKRPILLGVGEIKITIR
jgi:hypothetical protein